MTKVLSIISTYQTPHFEDLVYIEQILNDGSEVEIIDIAHNAPLRIDLPIDDKLRISMSKLYHNLIKKSFIKIYLRFIKKIVINTFKPNYNIGTLVQILNWDDLLNAYLSFWYVKRNTVGLEIDTDQLCEFYQLLVYSANIVENVKKKYSLDDKIIIFNARLPLEYFLHKGLEKAGFNNIHFLELSQYNQRILLRKDSPHDLKSFKNEIVELIETKSDNFIEDKFYELTKSLRADYLPLNNKEQNLVIIFTSSLDEFFFKFADVPNIFHIITILIEKLTDVGYNVVIRVHPITHMKSIENKISWMVLKHKYPDHVILWDEPVDSFDIIHKAAGVITFGSSLSAYAAAVGKSVIVLGDNTLYSNLSAVKSITYENFFCDNMSDLSYIKEVLNSETESSHEEQIEAKAAFIFERYLGFERNHRLLGKNIEKNVTIFKPDFTNLRLSNKDFELFDKFLRIYKLMLDYIELQKTLFAQNMDLHFLLEFSEESKIDIQFVSSSLPGKSPFDSCRNVIEYLNHAHEDVLDIRSVPLDFFCVEPKDLLTLAYESWSFPKRYFHKAAFYEAFYYWKKKYQIKMEQPR